MSHRKDDEHVGKSAESPSADDDLLRDIAEKKKKDPLIGLKIGSTKLNEYLMKTLMNEKGVHLETLLTALGSLAGFSCHMAVREEYVETGKHKGGDAYLAATCTDGSTYYFGSLINEPLVINPHSLWNLTAGIAEHLGATRLPDLKGIATHVMATAGGDAFGIQRVPENHKVPDLPINFVKYLWEYVTPILDYFCDNPLEKPILFGFAIQEIIQMGKDDIAPEMAVLIVMECAVPMSKLDPELIMPKNRNDGIRE